MILAAADPTWDSILTTDNASEASSFCSGLCNALDEPQTNMCQFVAKDDALLLDKNHFHWFVEYL